MKISSKCSPQKYFPTYLLCCILPTVHFTLLCFLRFPTFHLVTTLSLPDALAALAGNLQISKL